jgi:hypothetical protein
VSGGGRTRCARAAAGRANCFEEGIVSKRLPRARRDIKSSSRATRWLAIALLIWLAGALAGLATMPKTKAAGPTWAPKPPAHRPVDIESPSTHDVPPVA